MKLTKSQMQAALVGDLRNHLAQVSRSYQPMFRVTERGGLAFEVRSAHNEREEPWTVEYLTDYRKRTLRIEHRDPYRPFAEVDWCEEDLLHGE